MKNSILKIFIVSLFMMVLMIPTSNAEFLDVAPDFWGYSKIMEFSERGVINGYEDNTFKPNNTITRAEFVAMVNNFFGYTGNEEIQADFSDVDQDKWYADAINEAVARGYLSGYEDGTFKPNEPIKRQEAISILAKILGIADEDIPEVDEKYLEKFEDFEDISDWAEKAVYNYAVRNFITGYEDGTLKPRKNITRTETIYLLRAIEQQIVIEDIKPNKGGSSSGRGSSGGGSSSGGSSSSKYYTITLNVGENGSAVADETRVKSGNDVTITITPNDGYKVKVEDNSVNVTDKVENNVYAIDNVRADHIVNVIFELIEVDPENPDPENPNPENPDPENPDPENPNPENPDPENPDPENPNPENPDPENPDPENPDSEKPDTEETCTCRECLNKLLAVIEKLGNEKYEELLGKLQAAEGDAEKIKSEIEAWLNEQIENSEYKEEIEAVIDELKKIDCEDVAKDLVSGLKEFLSSEMWKDILDKIDEKFDDADRKKLEELLNKLKDELNYSKEKVEEIINEIIENHDCEKFQDFVNKLIEFLEDEKSVNELVNLFKEYLKDHVSEEELKETIRELVEKYEISLEELKEIISAEKAETIEAIKEKLEELKAEKEKIEEIVADLIEKLKENAPTEEELKEMAKELLEKGEATLKDLKEKLEEKLKENEDKIEEIINDLKEELKENCPTEEELREMVEELLAKGEATLEDVKDAIKTEIEEKLADEEWQEFLEEVKEQIKEEIANCPLTPELEEKIEELLSELEGEIENVIPKLEELTGIDFEKVAEKLGLEGKTVKEVIETVKENEELRNLIENTLKDKITDVVVNELSDNETVAKILDEIYKASEKDVIDILLILDEKEPSGIIAKIILSNTELSDVIDAMDEELSDEQVATIIEAVVDYYGLVDFVKEADTRENAKELLTVALKTADVVEIAEAMADPEAREIILKHFDIFELTEILGENGKEIIDGIWDNLSKEDLLEMLRTFTDKEELEKIAKVLKESFDYSEDVDDFIEDATEEIKNFLGVTTVSYDKNAEDATGSTESSTHNNIWEKSLTANGFERTGYAFIGWAKDATATVVDYTDKEKVKSSEFNVEAITLYAVWSANTYNVTGGYNENGNVVAAKVTEAKTGETVELDVTVAKYYEVIEIKANDTVVSENGGVYSFVMPGCDVTVSASFKYIAHDIIIDEAIENGTINTDKGIAIEGEVVSVSFSAAEGYELEKITVDGSAIEKVDGVYSFVMPNEDVTVSASFKVTYVAPTEYDITIDEAIENGTITTDKTEAEDGEVVTVGFTANTGYVLDKITVNGNEVTEKDGVYSFVMPSKAVIVSASFEKVYDITVDEEIENGTINTDKDTAIAGEVVTVEFTEKSGYELEKITVNGSEVEAVEDVYSFEMPTDDVLVSATFKAIEYTVSVGTITNGTVSVNKSTATVEDDITVTVKADTGYRLKEGSLKVDGTVIEDNEFDMLPNDVTITAEFEMIDYDITIDTDNCTAYVVPSIADIDITNLESLTTANYGDTMYVVYKVDAGCEFESFEIDKVDDTESGDLILGYAYKSFTMPASDIEISISCIEVEPVYSVTIGSVTNGTVTAAPNKELEEGDTVVLVTVGDVKEYKTVFGKKIPVSWYMLKTLTVTDENGNEVTVSNYTFKMPAGNVTITATFE